MYAVLNVADGDRYASCRIDLAVNANDAVHVMRAKVARVLFQLQQPNPYRAMSKVAKCVSIQSLVAHFSTASPAQKEQP